MWHSSTVTLYRHWNCLSQPSCSYPHRIKHWCSPKHQLAIKFSLRHVRDFWLVSRHFPDSCQIPAHFQVFQTSGHFFPTTLHGQMQTELYSTFRIIVIIWCMWTSFLHRSFQLRDCSWSLSVQCWVCLHVLQLLPQFVELVDVFQWNLTGTTLRRLSLQNVQWWWNSSDILCQEINTTLFLVTCR